MPGTDQFTPGEQEDAQLIHSLRSIYDTRIEDAEDLAEVRQRFQQDVHARSLPIVNPAAQAGEDMFGKDVSLERVSDDIIFTDLGSSIHPVIPRRQIVLSRPRYFVRIAEGAIAALVVIGLISAWVLLLPRMHPGGQGQTNNNNVPRPVGPIFFVNHDFGSVYLPQWTPDSKYMSFVDWNGGAYVWNASTNRLTKTITLPYPVSPDPSATWNRATDGRHIVSFNYKNRSMQVWDVITGKRILDNDTQSFSWSSDGGRIIVSDSKNNVRIWDTTNGKVLLTISSFPDYCCEWSPDGQRILATSNDGFTVLDAATGKPIHSIHDPIGAKGNDAWSPDGKRLLTAGDGSTASNSIQQIWDIATGHRLLTHQGLTSQWVQLRWSSDGKRILSFSDKDIQVWDPVTGHTILHIPDPSSQYTRYPGWPTLSPDGKVLGLDNGGPTVQLWDMNAGRKLFTYQDHTANLIKGSIGWSPDSKYVVMADEAGKVYVWNVNTGNVIRSYTFTWYPSEPAQPNSTGELVWSPNSKMIAIVSSYATAAVVQAPE